MTIVDTVVGPKYQDTLSKDKRFPLVISGNWIKVMYNGQTGYVFDGYISRIKPQIVFERFIDKPFKTFDTTLYWDNKPFKTSYQLYKTGDGAFYKYISEDGCWSHHYFFPNLSFEEGVMLMAETFKPDNFECPLKLKKVDSSGYFFEDCTLTTLRQIKVTATGIYIYTFDCT